MNKVFGLYGKFYFNNDDWHTDLISIYTNSQEADKHKQMWVEYSQNNCPDSKDEFFIEELNVFDSVKEGIEFEQNEISKALQKAEESKEPSMDFREFLRELDEM